MNQPIRGSVLMGETVALIPARGGSRRVPGKNTRLLNGKPLITYSIAAAQQSGEFNRVIVSSDDAKTLEIASQDGADVLRRPGPLSTDESPDIDWVRCAIDTVSSGHPQWTFSILRPTSPFRTTETIKRAFQLWRDRHASGFTSLRAVEPVSQHPGKMWRLHADEMIPLLPQPAPQPWHDSPHTLLPSVYVQNASLEISTADAVAKTGTISGQRVLPFVTRGIEGFDINSELDWQLAELLIEQKQAKLPVV